MGLHTRLPYVAIHTVGIQLACMLLWFSSTQHGSVVLTLCWEKEQLNIVNRTLVKISLLSLVNIHPRAQSPPWRSSCLFYHDK